MPEVICSSCGLTHERQPVKYDLGSEKDSFKEELTKFEVIDDECVIPRAYLEAGPYNGERFLIEEKVFFCECPGCGNSFTTSKTCPTKE